MFTHLASPEVRYPLISLLDHTLRLFAAVISVILPFLSPKAYAKIQPVPSLDDLYYTHHVSLKGIEVNLDTLLEEARVLRQSSKTSGSSKSGDRAPPNGPNAGWAYSTLTSTLSAASSYLPLPGFKVTRENSLTGKSETGRGYWRRTIEDLIKEADGKIPHLLEELSQAILSECTTTEGIFRRTSNVSQDVVSCSHISLTSDSLSSSSPWSEYSTFHPTINLLFLGLSELEMTLCSHRKFYFAF